MSGQLSPKILFVKVHCAFDEKIEIFFLKAPFRMMLLLAVDITFYKFPLRRADGKCSVTFLPFEAGLTYLFMDPLG